MKTVFLFVAFSPLAILASRCLTISCLARIALFAFLCYLWRIKEEFA